MPAPPTRPPGPKPAPLRRGHDFEPIDPGAALAAKTATLVRGWLETLRRPSPPFLVSLGVHVVLLLALALVVLRAESRRAIRLEMRFGDGGAPGDETASVEVAADVSEPSEQPTPSPTSVVGTMAPKTPQPEPEPEAEPEPSASAIATGRGEAARVPIESMLAGRSETGRAAGLQSSGGDDATERAVGLALDWIARQQQKSGRWSLKGPYADGGNQENQLAATAMALMALQGAGTSDAAGRHSATVRRAWEEVLANQRPDGTFDLGAMPDNHSMYSHAQITIAVCEASAMAEDPDLRRGLFEAAEKAMGYAVSSQMPDGGWRYGPPGRGGEDKGDMSVTGWFLMALKTAEMSGLKVPPEVYQRLTSFLDAVELTEASGICVGNDGEPLNGYGYQILPTQKVFVYRPALAAEGLLCRQHLGWDRDDPRIVAGVAQLLERSPINFRNRGKNVYAWYYQTQVFHNVGGEAWDRWNGAMRLVLPAEQVTERREKGSWDTTYDQWGSTAGGRLYMTSLFALMLESYYRHLPVYREATAAR